MTGIRPAIESAGFAIESDSADERPHVCIDDDARYEATYRGEIGYGHTSAEAIADVSRRLGLTPCEVCGDPLCESAHSDVTCRCDGCGQHVDDCGCVS